ncbi:PepSY-associated TM helix domain-containing protein [Marinobacter shengliensis]|uniref:PepSY-associated TM helix domain-containing protein n=1 Tax=Marinobacter shengliensis TaxID=1389223 RepID=UPI001E5622C0|nr:PepSY-associated TM helix domain-containing protein [Marinobacter shengliensis]MCD1631220.1 PepSY domain-containing protein [Marinobacter shengliensis]
MNDSPTTGAPRWGYALLLRLHFYAGLLVGPFIFVAALSGSLFAMTPQIENWLYQTELTTNTTGNPQPLADQITAARAHIGADATLAAVRPAPAERQTTRVMFLVDGLQPFEHKAVFVDPVNLGIHGELVVYGTSGTLPFRIWIDYVHRHLHLGEPGRYYSELAASWLWLVALGGLALWWRRRSVVKNGQITRNSSLRNWHSRIGLVLLVAFLFFSVTGLTWSKWAGANIAELRTQLNWATPGLDTQLDAVSSEVSHSHGEHAGHEVAGPVPGSGDNASTYDAVLERARRAGIDASILEIRPGTTPERAWVVREIDRSWPTQVDMVAVDPRSMAVTDHVKFENFPLAAKLTRWGIDAHMGILFGLPNQLLVAACALGLCVLIVLGYRMWWLRRPARTAHTRPNPRRVFAELRKASPLALVTMAGIAVALGLFAPVMGVSLLVFLMVDAILSLTGSATKSAN